MRRFEQDSMRTAAYNFNLDTVSDAHSSVPMHSKGGRTRRSPALSRFHALTRDNWTHPPGSTNVRRVLAAFFSTILFSVSVVCGHRSAKLIGGTEANFWRLACATLMLGIGAYAFGIGLEGQAFPVFLLSGILGIGVGDVALFQALPRLGSRLSMLLIQCLTAPAAALLEWGWLGTTLTGRQIVCGIIILVGVGIAL